MALPHPDVPSSSFQGADVVVLPLRSLRRGKQRLQSVLSETERSALIAAMAERVVNAAFELPVVVVHDDPEVAPWATERGAMAFRPQTPGLNHAVSASRDLLAALGANRLIIAHGDLPLVEDLRPMLSDSTISIAPDRHGDGTNVLCVPAALGFDFAYGPGSFDSHCEIARSLGIEPRIVSSPDLACDLDHPDDLAGLPPLPQLLEQDHR